MCSVSVKSSSCHLWVETRGFRYFARIPAQRRARCECDGMVVFGALCRRHGWSLDWCKRWGHEMMMGRYAGGGTVTAVTPLVDYLKGSSGDGGNGRAENF